MPYDKVATPDQPGIEFPDCFKITNKDGEVLEVAVDWTNMPLGIEAGVAPVGCVEDDDGNVTGLVFLCKKTDEETGVNTISNILLNIDGSIVDPYTGAWKTCEAKVCLIVNPECLKVRNYEIRYDNGRGGPISPGNIINSQWPITDSNISINGQNIALNIVQGHPAGGPGWTAQLTEWAAEINSNNINSADTAAFDFAPAPIWRHIDVTGCTPDAVYGPMTLKRDNGTTYTVYPTLDNESVDLFYRYIKLDPQTKEKTVVWCDSKGAAVEAPEQSIIDCMVPCSAPLNPVIEAAPEGLAETTGRILCDDKGEFYQLCTMSNGTTLYENYTLASALNAVNPDDLTDYTPVGIIKDCATQQPIPECEMKDTVSKCVPEGVTVSDDGSTITTATVESSQPTAGFAIIGLANANDPIDLTNFLLPGTLTSCLGDTIVDTLVNPNLLAGTTTFSVDLEILDAGQNDAAFLAVDKSTGLALPAPTTTGSAFGPNVVSQNGGGNATTPGVYTTTWAIPAGVDPTNVCLILSVVGGVLNNPDPGLCDTFQFNEIRSDAPVSHKCVQNVKIEGSVKIDGPIDVNVIEPPKLECQIDYLLKCDDVNGDGSLIVQYAEALQTCFLDGVMQGDPVNVGSFDDDGASYTPTNPIECDPATLDFDEEIFCDTGSNTNFIRRTIVIAGQGAIVEQVSINDGVTPYVPTGLVEAGPCKIEPTVEACPVKTCKIQGGLSGILNFTVTIDGQPFTPTGNGVFEQLQSVADQVGGTLSFFGRDSFCITTLTPVAIVISKDQVTYTSEESSEIKNVMYVKDASTKMICEKLDKIIECLGGGATKEVCDFTVQFKSAGVTSIITDKGELIAAPIDVANTSAGQNASNNTDVAAIQNAIQVFLDANGGGTATVEYPSESILTITVTGTTCTFTTADDDSNPGPHSFVKESA